MLKRFIVQPHSKEGVWWIEDSHYETNGEPRRAVVINFTRLSRAEHVASLMNNELYEERRAQEKAGK